MYGRCERPFFMWSCTRSRKTIDTLNAWSVAHDPMHWSDARVIAYIRTCARVLLIEPWLYYETMLSTMHVEKCFNTIINI